jgi:hypothetical protein
MDYFPVGTPEGVSPRTSKDLLARLQAGVTMADATMFQRMPPGALMSALKRAEDTLKT